MSAREKRERERGRHLGMSDKSLEAMAYLSSKALRATWEELSERMLTERNAAKRRRVIIESKAATTN